MTSPAERGVFKRVRSVIIRPSQTPPSAVPRGILTRSLSARGDAEKRRRGVLRRQNAIDFQEEADPPHPHHPKIVSTTESDTWLLTMAMTARPTSLSDSGVHLSPDAITSEMLTSDLTLNSLADDTLLATSVMGENGKRCDDNTRAKSRMEKYFAEKPDKNIFMKLIHPSYHERNLQFKKIFVDKGLIDESDQFLASYSCAYQREILAQGRMFISQFNVCFYANIIGWETTLVIPMKEVKLIKKMKAAFIFPNSIQFERQTDEKYFFASFINRDKSFQVLTTAHQKVHEGRPMTREEVWDMVYNSEDKNIPNQTPSEGGTPASTKHASTENVTALSSPSFNGSTMRSSEKDNASQSSSTSSGEAIIHDDSSGDAHFEEDVQNIYEECPCTNHFGKVLFDEEYKMSVEKFYELVFTESKFFEEFNARSRIADFVASSWVRDHVGENTRTWSYSISLSNPMAPKAISVTERQSLRRFPRGGLTVSKETENKGVPYSDSFTVNAQYCLTRTGPMSCRVKVHGGIMYKKNVWNMAKVFIEKGTNGGLDDHYSLLRTMMAEYMEKHPDGGSAPPPNVIPFLRDETPAPTRSRSSQKEPRLHAGGDHKTEEIQAPRAMSSLRDESLLIKTTMSSPTPPIDYTHYLNIIIALLALFVVLNFYVAFRSSSEHVVSTKEEHIEEMMKLMMEQLKELRMQVSQMKREL